MSPPATMPTVFLRVSNLVGFVFLILVNVLSNTGYFGATNADISAKYPTPLTPAGWAFGIWALIFLLQGCGVAYQLLPQSYQSDAWTADVVSTIGYGWLVGWSMECAWQLAFVRESHASFWLCTAFLLLGFYQFFASLLRLYKLLEFRRQNIPATLFILYLLPTSVNAAWLSVASSLGLLIVPVSYGVSNVALQPLAAILAVIVSAAGLFMLVKKRDAAYGLTLTWALVAVYGNHKSPWIKAIALAAIVVLSMFSMFALTRRKQNDAMEFDEYEDVHDVLLDRASSQDILVRGQDSV